MKRHFLLLPIILLFSLPACTSRRSTLPRDTPVDKPMKRRIDESLKRMQNPNDRSSFDKDRQATLGKKVMGIKVADVSGARISLGRATLRLAIKALLSGWFLIGYIMAFFTQRKQALHDMIAGTLVLTRDEYPAVAAGYPQQQQQYPPPNPYAAQPANYPPPQPPAGCPHCGAALPPGARFCSNCGKNT